MKTILIALLLSTTVFASEAELKAQIEKLRQQNEAIETRLTEIQTQSKAATEQKTAADSDVKIGGYGELIYNAYSNDSSRNRIDFKRFVLFFSKQFNEKISFNSEVEIEHSVAAAGASGEVALEQAYINYQFSPELNLKAGLMLMPFGFINESHEPPTFYGVERNEIETRIIPSTWREGGVSLSGTTAANLDWSLGVVTAFNMAKFSDTAKPLKSLRQKLEQAKARDFALFGTLNYKVPGFVLGTAVYSGDSMQGNANYNSDTTLPDFAGINARITLADVHVRWEHGGWDSQALYAKGMIADADRIDQVLLAYNTANATSLPYVASEFYGWLVQTAYVFPCGSEATIAPFVRYEEFDSQSKMPTGFAANAANVDHLTTAGLSYKSHPGVVVKADYQNYNDTNSRNRFNLGLGYMF